jgi:hypothetical protein
MLHSKTTAFLKILNHSLISKTRFLQFAETTVATSFLSSVHPSGVQEIESPHMFGYLHKNVNFPWMIGTSIAVWFLFIHAPPFWRQRQLLRRDVLLAVHIVAAGWLYLSCVHNCLFTPSFMFFGKPSKLVHTWVGRTGLGAGIISFSLGAFLAWSRIGLDGVEGTTVSWALPITIGGIFQLFAQYFGYKAIRLYKSLKEEISTRTREFQDSRISTDENAFRTQELNELKLTQRRALGNHIGNMIGLFVNACGIPAGIRMAELLGGQNDMITISIIVAMIGTFSMIVPRYMKLMMPEALNESGNLLSSG